MFQNQLLFTVVLLASPAVYGQTGRAHVAEGTVSAPRNKSIDFAGFLKQAAQLEKLREQCRVGVEQFVAMIDQPGTVLLDTRSADAFQSSHVVGAVHLNFSDFTDSKLASVIPTKHTRVLIYCNNNFDTETDVRVRVGSKAALTSLNDKRAPLALNIPTFINLHGYGYENVYELADRVSVNDPRIKLAGTDVATVE